MDLDLDCLIARAIEMRGNQEFADLTGMAVRLGSEKAKEILWDAIDSGDMRAAALAFDENLLFEERARKLMKSLEALLQDEQSKAARGTYGLGRAVDPCGLLVALCFRFPRIARWSLISKYLGDSNVLADHKVMSCRLIVECRKELSSEIISLLSTSFAGLAASRASPKNIFAIDSPASVATGLSEFFEFGLKKDGGELDEYICGSLQCPKDYGHLAWVLLSRDLPSGYDLLAVYSLADDEFTVRASAARFLALRVSAGADSPCLRRASRRILADPGTRIATVFLSNISGECPTWLDELRNL